MSLILRWLDSDVTLQPDDRFLTLPRLLKTWVDNVAFRAYINACLAESKSSCVANSDSFKAKEHKVLGALQSDIHVLGLKKQHAQVEVDMLSDAIARMSEFERTDDGVHAITMLLFLILK